MSSFTVSPLHVTISLTPIFPSESWRGGGFWIDGIKTTSDFMFKNETFHWMSLPVHTWSTIDRRDYVDLSLDEL